MLFKVVLALLIIVLVFDVVQASPRTAAEDRTQICDAIPGESGWWRGAMPLMGTRVTVELRAGDREPGCAAVESVFAEIQRIDALMSSWKPDSELSRLNREAPRGFVPIDPELFALIVRSLDVSELTRGAFDITYASAGRFYDFRAARRPEDDARVAAVEAIDWRHLAVDHERSAIAYRHPKVHVDLGGIAKGYAVDRAISLLQARGIQDAMVSAGGDSRIVGDRGGEPWVVGIRDPRVRDQSVAVLPLMDVAVSTSGDYERFFIEDGVRYHHIIDPQTGDSARDVRAVTILGADATTTDALSTSVFVMGLERGLALIDTLPGIDAIVVDGRGRLLASRDLMGVGPSTGLAAGSAR